MYYNTVKYYTVIKFETTVVSETESTGLILIFGKLIFIFILIN